MKLGPRFDCPVPVFPDVGPVETAILELFLRWEVHMQYQLRAAALTESMWLPAVVFCSSVSTRTNSYGYPVRPGDVTESPNFDWLWGPNG